MIELYCRGWRPHLEALLQSADQNVLIASPYIKTREAQWVCKTLVGSRAGSVPRLRVLTDLRSDSVLSGALDVQALRVFCKAGDDAKVINLPRLHSKVYIADTKAAIVTSANLTPAGLEENFEYGIGVKDRAIAGAIRADLESYARVGNPLDPGVLRQLEDVAEDLRRKYGEVQRSSHARLRRQFRQTLGRANTEFLKAQVGTRSAHSLFTDAIIYALSARGPTETRRLAPEIQKLLPDLCDDRVELIINGERFGKRWKHDVRNAQQALKRQDIVTFDGKRWALSEQYRGSRPAV